MRHRTALPFLDAFLKPTKHIRSGLFLHYMVCNFCEIRKKEKADGFGPSSTHHSVVALPPELLPFHYRTCNFCEIEIKNHSRGIFEKSKKRNPCEFQHHPILSYLKLFLGLLVLASTPLVSFHKSLLVMCRFLQQVSLIIVQHFPNLSSF